VCFCEGSRKGRVERVDGLRLPESDATSSHITVQGILTSGGTMYSMSYRNPPQRDSARDRPPSENAHPCAATGRAPD